VALAKKVLKFFHELTDEGGDADRPKAADTQESMREAYAGFMALSACDPFVYSNQNMTPIFMGAGMN